nr:uncharacterized protein LOC109172479 [Ipomoea batatas]
MKPDINLVLQALLVIALLSASPALGAETPKTTEGGEAAAVGADGQHVGDMKPVNYGYKWGIKGGAGHSIGYGWPYKGGHGWGWKGGYGGCKLGCCFHFAGKCKYCCKSVEEAQAYNKNYEPKLTPP